MAKAHQSRINKEFNKYKQWCGIYGKKPSRYENLKEFYKVLEVVKWIKLKWLSFS